MIRERRVAEGLLISSISSLLPLRSWIGLPSRAPAAVRELYRTADPIPDLKLGVYDLKLARVTSHQQRINS
jgi:hypothetical protein